MAAAIELAGVGKRYVLQSGEPLLPNRLRRRSTSEELWALRDVDLTAAEVARDFDAIVDFSEIEKFLDTPVKYYSSGMFLRLAFAVAIHTNPRCCSSTRCSRSATSPSSSSAWSGYARCRSAARRSSSSRTTCRCSTGLRPRGVLLRDGQVAFDGPVEGALSADRSAMEGRAAGDDTTARVRVELLDEDGRPTRHFATGGTVQQRVHTDVDDELASPVLGVMVAPLGLGAAYAMHTGIGAYDGVHGPGRPVEAEVELTNRMLDGSYSVTVAVHDATGGRQLGASEPAVFYVSSEEGGAYGVVDLSARISIDGRVVADPGRQRLA